MTTNKPEVKRYDCTSGGARHCYGCYTMKEGELGDYVEWEAYEALQAECDALVEALDGAARSLETISKLAGRDEYMQEMIEVRGYASSRAAVARSALSAHREQQGGDV